MKPSGKMIKRILMQMMHSETLKRVKPLRVSMRWVAQGFINSLAFIKGLWFPPQWGWAPKMKFMFGLYEPGTTALCKEIVKPGMYVMDVGAHIGYYTLLFSKLVGSDGRVYAFEPHPQIFEMLRYNTRNRKNVVLLRKAVSNKMGEREFFFSKKTTGSHSFYTTEFTTGSCRVETVYLDEFFRAEGIKRCDLIKIDVEGAEPLVIEGMRNLIKSADKLLIILEFNPSTLRSGNHNPEGFLDVLLKKFNVYVINEQDGSLNPLTDIDLAKHIPEWKAVNLLCSKGVKL